jgi:hypothetical protein
VLQELKKEQTKIPNVGGFVFTDPMASPSRMFERLGSERWIPQSRKNSSRMTMLCLMTCDVARSLDGPGGHSTRYRDGMLGAQADQCA